MGELLSDPAAPRDPGDIDLPMPELGDDPSRKPRERRWPIGKGRKRRAADARDVKDDGRRIGQRMKKWFGELPIRANTIEQKQGRPPFRPACGRNAERLAADRYRPNVDAIFSRPVVPGPRPQAPRNRLYANDLHPIDRRHTSQGPAHPHDDAHYPTWWVPALPRPNARGANRASGATSFPRASGCRPGMRPGQPARAVR